MTGPVPANELRRHCPGCEVAWTGHEPCFICGRSGATTGYGALQLRVIGARSEDEPAAPSPRQYAGALADIRRRMP